MSSVVNILAISAYSVISALFEEQHSPLVHVGGRVLGRAEVRGANDIGQVVVPSAV